MNKDEKKAHFDGYILGILHTLEYLMERVDQPSLALEIRTELLQGVSDSKLKKICKAENIQINWKQMK